MSADDDDSDDLATAQLEAMRRKYDRKEARLQAIDTKAMQTARTAILILGFIASAATVAGPAAIGNLNPITAATAILAPLLLVLAGFLAIALYTITVVPEDIPRSLTAPNIDRSVAGWSTEAAAVLHASIEDLNTELAKNQTYLEHANFLLFVGITGLVIGAGTLVAVRAFGIPVLVIFVLLLVVSGLLVLALRLMPFAE